LKKSATDRVNHTKIAKKAQIRKKEYYEILKENNLI